MSSHLVAGESRAMALWSLWKLSTKPRRTLRTEILPKILD